MFGWVLGVGWSGWLLGWVVGLGAGSFFSFLFLVFKFLVFCFSLLGISFCFSFFLVFNFAEKPKTKH